MNSTSNPYTEQILLLESSIYLPSSTGYTHHLQALQIGLGLILLLQLITLYLRYRSNSLWFFRFTSSNSDTRLITPNSIILWTTLSVCFALCLQGFMMTLKNYSTVGSDLNNVMLFRTLVFIPLFYALWSMTWATAIAPIVSRQSIGQLSKRSDFFSRNPVLVNSFFIAVPLLLLATIIPFAILLNTTFNQAFSNYRVLHSLLEQASNSFDAGIPINSTDQLLIEELAFTLIVVSQTLIKRWTATFVTWSVYVGFCGLIFLYAAINHFKSIGNAMSTIRSNMRSTKSDYSIQMNHLVYSYRSLIANSILVLIMTAGFFSLDVLLAAKTKEIAQKGSMTEILLLVYLYLFLVFGGFSTLSILVASIKGNNRLAAVQVHSVVPTTTFRRPTALIFEQIHIQTIEVAENKDFVTGEIEESRKNATVNAFDIELEGREEIWEKQYPFMAR